MEATATYSYVAVNEDEMSFMEGDILKILSEGDQQWYYAELNGNLGLVPYNYLKFEPPAWYVNVSKEQASDMLKRSSTSPLNFLVRPSKTSSNGMSLSVMIKDPQHFKILRSQESRYYLWNDGEKFNSINELVKYYETHSVCLNEDVFLRTKSKQVIALYSFESRSSEEMSLFEGDVINFIEKVDSDWSRGSINRKGKIIQGLYPNSYVKEK